MQTVVTKKVLPELRYDSSADVSMRLRETIVRYKGEPVMVRGPIDPGSSQLVIAVVNLLTNEEFWCHSSDELLDISSLPLGWCYSTNHGYPVYLMRTTRNSQRQGVHPQALDVYDPIGRGQFSHGFQYRRYEELKSLAEFATGKVEAISKVVNGQYGGPLSRDWALINPRPDREKGFFTIYHKLIEVGTYRADRKEFFFRRDRLTKTRRVALEDMFALPINKGVSYGIAQQA